MNNPETQKTIDIRHRTKSNKKYNTENQKDKEQKKPKTSG